MINLSNVNNVTYGKPKVGGAIAVGDLTAVLPKNATDKLDVSLKELGYISEDGLTHQNETETEEIKAWGGDTVLTSLTGKTDAFQFTLIETLNVDVLKLVFGSDNVEGDLENGIKIKANIGQSEARSYVIDMILKNGVMKRIVIPNGVITETEDIEYKDDEVVGYGITVKALPDTEGNTHYEYIQNKAK